MSSRTIDLTVRGAGVIGLSIAWTAHRRGARVQVIDPAGPGAGASGGLVGALAPHVPENWNPKKAFQLRSLLMADPFWSDVAEASGLPTGYARTGRLQPIADAAASALAQARAGTAADLWQGAAHWRVVTAPSHWCPASPTGEVIHDTLSALLHPRRATLALAQALRSQGVPIAPQGDNTGAVIHATGAAGLADLSADLGHPMGQGIKGQAALLRLDRAGAPQIFAGGLHVIPHLDGTVALGSTTEREFDDPTGTDAALDDLIERARTAVPDLADAPVIARWAGLRPRARSRAPILGPWPGRPGHFVANGGFKIGFGMATAIAETMADLVLENHDTIPEGFAVADNLPK